MNNYFAAVAVFLLLVCVTVEAAQTRCGDADAH